jgi:hypothetical protein
MPRRPPEAPEIASLVKTTFPGWHLLFASILASAPALAQDRGEPARVPFPAGYTTQDALKAALERLLAEDPGLLRVRTLAQSTEGRDVPIVEIGKVARPGQPAPGPAILLVANLEGDHLLGTDVALSLIERLARREGRPEALSRLLERGAIYVVPRFNPDAAERLLGTKPAVAIRTNLRLIDRDRDGAQGEDGPDDLDGDGLITSIRVADRQASLLPDEKDPRILRKADPAKGEAGLYSEYIEGRDNDDDGALNEDPPGGVNLNRNWPHRWTEFDPEAGQTPVSEPQVKALIAFLFDHPEIAVVWSFSLNDNLREEPKKPPSTLDDADLPLFVELSKLYRKAIECVPKDQPRPGDDRPPEVPEVRPSPAVASPTSARPPLGLDATTDGSLSEWAYHQFGAIGLSSRLWNGPLWPEPADDGMPSPPREGEARWLFWNDRVLDGSAFVPLRPVDHPTLGRVLVGGWKPGVRLNPPHEQVAPIAEAQLAFLAELATRLPGLAIPVAEGRALGGGLFAVTAVVENTGAFPTALAQGVKTRQARPVLVRLDAGQGKIVAGKPLDSIDSLPGPRGRRTFRWIVSTGDRTGPVTIEASSPRCGTARAVVELK